MGRRVRLGVERVGHFAKLFQIRDILTGLCIFRLNETHVSWARIFADVLSHKQQLRRAHIKNGDTQRMERGTQALLGKGPRSNDQSCG